MTKNLYEECAKASLRPAEKFSAAEVAAAVKRSQAGESSYPEFMKRIEAAGTAYYITYLKGRRVVYLGREGDSHTEHFPGSRQSVPRAGICPKMPLILSLPRLFP